MPLKSLYLWIRCNIYVIVRRRRCCRFRRYFFNFFFCYSKYTFRNKDSNITQYERIGGKHQREKFTVKYTRRHMQNETLALKMKMKMKLKEKQSKNE